MNHQQAKIEAERCLYCFDAPCTEACPTHIDIPTFISMIRSGNIRGAAEVVKTSNALANVCGKVCPEEVFCQSVCTRAKLDMPIQIRELHFVATQTEARHGYSKPREFPKSTRKVAVIGGGPAGMGCAFELAKLGVQATIFDGNKLGGVPHRSIPSFRLSPQEVEDDTRFIARHFQLIQETIDESRFEVIRKDHTAVFVSVGLGKDRALGIKGEHLDGVIPVLEFLDQAKRSRVNMGKNVVIVGGGNVSLDAAATAKRLGASGVALIYRRSEKEMRVWKSELNEARAQGVDLRFLTTPVEILGTGQVSGIVCRKTRLSDRRDQTGRRIPEKVAGSDHTLTADTIIVAIGQEIPGDVFPGLRRTAEGYIAVDENLVTSERGVFAGGDAIAGEGTIVQSVAHGKRAAQSILSYLKGVDL